MAGATMPFNAVFSHSLPRKNPNMPRSAIANILMKSHPISKTSLAISNTAPNGAITFVPFCICRLYKHQLVSNIVCFALVYVFSLFFTFYEHEKPTTINGGQKALATECQHSLFLFTELLFMIDLSQGLRSPPA